MRPIDADALEKTLRDWIRDHWTEAFTGDDAGLEFADMIEHAETIEQSPIAHAHWIPDESETGEGSNTYKCSACGGIQTIIYGTPKENGWKYCPSCGAEMDEEAGNDTGTER